MGVPTLSPATTSPQHRHEGEVWHGTGNRWFQLKQGRVVPAKNPGATDGGTAPASPSPDEPLPDARASGIQSAASAAHVALSDPHSLTFAHVAQLAGHLSKLDPAAIKKLADDVASAAGGETGVLAGKLLGYVKAGATGAAGDDDDDGAIDPDTDPDLAPDAADTPDLSPDELDQAAAPPDAPPASAPLAKPPLGDKPAHQKAKQPPQVKADTPIGVAEAKALVQSTFGKDIPVARLAAGCNAADGAKVSISKTVHSGMLKVDVRNPDGGYVTRTFFRTRHGLVCHNDYFSNPKSSKVRGADLLLGQIQSLREMGVNAIETLAARGGDNLNDPLVGYCVWPKLGYEGTMSDKQFAKLPDHIRAAMGEKKAKFGFIGGSKGSRSLRELYDKVPGGAEAWEKFGSSVEMHFDLADDSPNMVALESYLKKREMKQTQGQGQGAMSA